MKRLVIAVLVCAAALAANSARAHTRVSVGVHVGGPAYVPAAPVVVHAPARAYCPPPAVVHYTPARGYWKEVVVKTWVPARWVYTRDYCGRRVRIYERGHYAYHTDRVWVGGRHHGRYGWRR